MPKIISTLELLRPQVAAVRKVQPAEYKRRKYRKRAHHQKSIPERIVGLRANIPVILKNL